MTDSTPSPVYTGQGPLQDAHQIDDGTELRNYLADPSNEGHYVHTRLQTSERVLARVTDGIYREPASALRELISNAWDADANLVTIQTDAPRFSQITVSDDGIGMSYETLARLVHSIGGSAKRTAAGAELGITSDDPDLSPSGRPIIGKIGIGLFSVSQLARRFRIITKVEGEPYRLIAEVRLRAYSENSEEDTQREGDDKYATGDVFILREPAEDIEAHGTDVIIDDVKPRVRDLLRSAERWAAVEEKARAAESGNLDDWVDIKVEQPKWHSGWIKDWRAEQTKPAILEVGASLPWTADTPSSQRMLRLVEAVEAETTRIDRPDLATTLDTYLEMVWKLALSAPVKYLEGHPFDLTSESGVTVYWTSNEARGQAKPVPLPVGLTVREAVQVAIPGHPMLESGLPTPGGDFTVRLDGIELRRPIRFRFAGSDGRGLSGPILLVGRFAPDLSRVDESRRGGDLALEGYLFWNSRIVPKENNGVLVRIRGASGALFDPTFFGYQISEQTRLRQITAELFIQKGLDAALNIDRESFNFSHPHVQIVTLWLHRAIRQLTNRHKDLSQRLRDERRIQAFTASQSALERYSADVWRDRQGSDLLPIVTIAADPRTATIARQEGAVALIRSEIPSLARAHAGERQQRDAKAQALVQVLAAYGVLSDRPFREQQALVDAILTIFLDPPGYE